MKLQSLKNTIAQLFAILVMLVLVGCSSSEPAPPPELGKPDRPEWVTKIPKKDENGLYFVGISKPYATHQDARKDAMRDARSQVVDYMGAYSESKFKEQSISTGFSSDVVDPSAVVKIMKREMSGAITRELGQVDTHPEEVTVNNKRGYTYWVLTQIQEKQLDKSYREGAKKAAEELTRRAKETREADFKQQIENGIEALNKMEAAGFGEF